MRKNIFISILFLLFGYTAFAQDCLSNSITLCTEENSYCIPNAAITNLNSDPFYNSRGLHTCLLSQPGPNWVMIRIAHPGDLLIYIELYSQYDNENCRPNTSSAPLDIDFACWGPFPDTIPSAKRFKQYLCENRFTLQSTSSSGGPTTHRPTNGNHNNDMGGYPYNTNPNNPYNIALTDCSYHSAGTEWCFLPNAQQAKWYLLLICNYSRQPGFFKLTTLHSSASGSLGYTGSTNCDVLNCLSTNDEMPCEGNPFKLYCNVPEEDIETDGQALLYKWVMPNQIDTIVTTDSVITLIADTSMTGTFELIIEGTNPPRHGYMSTYVQATPAIIHASDDYICQGDSVILSTPYYPDYDPDHTDGYGYCRWFIDSIVGMPLSTDTSVVVFPTEDSQYILRVRSGYSECSNSDTVNIYVGQPDTTDFTVNTTEDCYVWNGVEYCESGDYVQTLQSIYGCDSLVTMHLNIVVGVDQYPDAVFRVSPNPTNDKVNVELGVEHKGKEISLVDMLGKVLKTIKIEGSNTQIDLSGCTNGVYLLKLMDSNNHVMAVRKIVKQ